jgi:hypothetical protein
VDEKLREPAFATVTGLLNYGAQSRAESAPAKRAGTGGFIKKLFAVGN